MNMMSHWEESKPEVFKYQLHHVEQLIEGLVLELEYKVAHFYMQTFYNYFLLSSHIVFCLLYDLACVFHVFFNTSFDLCR